MKGKGFLPAECDPITYHAITKLKKINPAQEKSVPVASQKPVPTPAKKYSQVFGEFICDKAATDKQLMAIT
ncbi:hypothetical protein K4H00_27085, partial [Mycobacterium tuberculosis]|nr:hypothetical protein [Mycobacterium tuberculosis]